MREPNGAKQFWARGNGWVLAAFPLILENLPEEYLKRDYYIRLYKEMAARILQTQDAQGSWHASLLDAGTYPQPEIVPLLLFVMAWLGECVMVF